MTNTSYASALIFFILGIIITIGFYSYVKNDVPVSAGIKNQVGVSRSAGTNTGELNTFDDRITGLEAASDRIQYSVDDMNEKMGFILDKLGDTGDHRTSLHEGEAPAAAAKPQSKENVAYYKEKIYNDISDTTKTLPSILNSSEMAALPPQDQKEILDELARKIDSGEIDKSKFLPGYRSKN